MTTARKIPAVNRPAKRAARPAPVARKPASGASTKPLRKPSAATGGHHQVRPATTNQPRRGTRTGQGRQGQETQAGA